VIPKLGQALLPKTEELVRKTLKGTEMLNYNDGLSAHKMAAIFFAFVAAASAISTAVAPAFL
jgi:hypothetical protein